MVGWPKGRHGPLRRRPINELVSLDGWDEPANELLAAEETVRDASPE